MLTGVLAAPATADAAPPPAGGTLRISVSAPERDHGRPFALSGDRVVVRGRLSRYVPNQRVRVRVYRGSRKLHVASRKVLPATDGSGRFTARLTAPGGGRLTVRAVKRRTEAQKLLVARPKRLVVASPELGAGARGPAVRLLQRRLAARRYVVPRGGVLDGRTANAIVAFRKLTGMRRVGGASRELFQRLRAGQGAWRVRHPEHGHHVEADLSQQVLALIDGGRVQRIYTTSSGKPSTPTVVGSFRVYMKTPGVNQKGMIDSSYFIRGYAIHGYPSVPVFAASHGCLRIPAGDARSVYDWLRPGDVVDVAP